MNKPSKMAHPVVRVMAVIFGVVALGFSAIGAYALFIYGWSWHVFSATFAMATLATIFIIGGAKGPGKLPTKGYSLLGGP
jgi:membrane protein YdbS with pleckstrin-like domain